MITVRSSSTEMSSQDVLWSTNNLRLSDPAASEGATGYLPSSETTSLYEEFAFSANKFGGWNTSGSLYTFASLGVWSVSYTQFVVVEWSIPNDPSFYYFYLLNWIQIGCPLLLLLFFRELLHRYL